MSRTSVMCLLAIIATTGLAAPSGRGGKGRGCKNKPSPCADGSSPVCPDGGQLDSNAKPPICSDGRSPVCNDGVVPGFPHAGERNDPHRNRLGRRGRDNRDAEDNDRDRSPSVGRGRDSHDNEDNDDKSDDECDSEKTGPLGTHKNLGMVIGASAGGSLIIISLCCCAYCWRRAARLANTKEQSPPTEIVVGKTVQGCVDFEPKQDMQSAVVVGHVPQNLEHGSSIAPAASANVASDDSLIVPSEEAV